MFRGRIILHDPLEGRGLIKLDGSFDTVSFSELHLVNRPRHGRSLEQRDVSFELMHTPEGYTPHNIKLISATSGGLVDWILAIGVPLAVVSATYAAHSFLRWPYVHSYLLAINVATLALVLLVSRHPRVAQLTPLEVEIIALSILGGAVGTIVGSQLVFSRFRYAPARYGIVALALLHIVVLQLYFPSFFLESSWRRIIDLR